jgi:hypothetical protein
LEIGPTRRGNEILEMGPTRRGNEIPAFKSPVSPDMKKVQVYSGRKMKYLI